MNKYKCPKCGFIYDDEKENILFTDLDDNYFCPFCLTPKKEFTLEEEQPKKEVVEKRVQISPDNPSIARIEEKCINCGICKININTELQVKWSKEVRKYLTDNNDVYDPRKIIKSGEKAIKEAVIQKNKLLGSAGKAL